MPSFPETLILEREQNLAIPRLRPNHVTLVTPVAITDVGCGNEGQGRTEPGDHLVFVYVVWRPTAGLNRRGFLLSAVQTSPADGIRPRSFVKQFRTCFWRA
jgi:hypothetical protein